MIKILAILLALTLTMSLSVADSPEEVTAYLQFASASWSAQYWYDGSTYPGVKAHNERVTGPGADERGKGLPQPLPEDHADPC